MDDQFYTILSGTLVFRDNGVNLNPEPTEDPSWLFFHADIASDGSALDSDLIIFDSATEEFYVYTDQQDKAGSYTIRYQKQADVGVLKSSYVTAYFSLVVEETPNTCEFAEITIHEEPEEIHYLIGSG